MWVLDKPPAETGAQQWYPADAAAEQRLRVTSPGLLDHLCAGYGCGVRPLIGTWKGYRSTAQLADATRGTTWSGSLAVLRLTARERRHRRLDLRSTLAVTGRLQQAFLSAAHAAGFNPIPEWVSGHQADGGPSDLPHLACLPLAFVGRPHADGHLLGLGMAIPAGTKPGDRRLVLRILGLIKELQLGRLGLWELAPELSDVSPFNLQSSTWTGGQDGAARWATVTPIAFDQHPKAKDRASYEREATDIVRRSCVRIGLPEPAQVILTSVSAHLGVPAAHEFPRLKRKDGSERRHRHAILLFNEPVQGPIAIGAGRYRGYGFCRPIREGHRG
jgi:CRISPR-associated protein Csb2